MQLLKAIPNATQTTIGLFLVRVVLGVIFILHGGQKLFQFGVSGFSGGLEQMGVPLAGLFGFLVVVAEFGGGIALVLGLLTRLAGMGIAATMIGAIWLVHLKNGFFAPDGYEFPLMLLAAALGMVIMGPGAWSLDAVLAQRLGAAELSPARVSQPASV